jgi:hypothetical protein
MQSFSTWASRQHARSLTAAITGAPVAPEDLLDTSAHLTGAACAQLHVNNISKHQSHLESNQLPACQATTSKCMTCFVCALNSPLRNAVKPAITALPCTMTADVPAGERLDSALATYRLLSSRLAALSGMAHEAHSSCCSDPGLTIGTQVRRVAKST